MLHQLRKKRASLLYMASILLLLFLLIADLCSVCSLATFEMLRPHKQQQVLSLAGSMEASEETHPIAAAAIVNHGGNTNGMLPATQTAVVRA